MRLRWTHEDSPAWDKDKQRVIGGAPDGALEISHEPGAPLPGDWWAATDEQGDVIGYGWLDATWGGDAEILLAVDSGRQQQGAGAFILDRLEQEAADRGLNYVYNTVRETHPDRDGVHDWLAVRGYRDSDSDTALRKHVVSRTSYYDPAAPPAGPASRTPLASGTPPAAASAPAAGPGAATDQPPGDEASGGYVDIEDHKF